MKVALRETPAIVGYKNDIDVELHADGYLSIFEFNKIGDKVDSSMVLLRPEEVQKLREVLNDSPASV